MLLGGHLGPIQHRALNIGLKGGNQAPVTPARQLLGVNIGEGPVEAAFRLFDKVISVS